MSAWSLITRLCMISASGPWSWLHQPLETWITSFQQSCLELHAVCDSQVYVIFASSKVICLVIKLHRTFVSAASFLMHYQYLSQMERIPIVWTCIVIKFCSLYELLSSILTGEAFVSSTYTSQTEAIQDSHRFFLGHLNVGAYSFPVVFPSCLLEFHLQNLLSCVS